MEEEQKERVLDIIEKVDTVAENEEVDRVESVTEQDKEILVNRELVKGGRIQYTVLINPDYDEEKMKEMKEKQKKKEGRK